MLIVKKSLQKKSKSFLRVTVPVLKNKIFARKGVNVKDRITHIALQCTIQSRSIYFPAEIFIIWSHAEIYVEKLKQRRYSNESNHLGPNVATSWNMFQTMPTNSRNVTVSDGMSARIPSRPRNRRSVLRTLHPCHTRSRTTNTTPSRPTRSSGQNCSASTLNSLFPTAPCRKIPTTDLTTTKSGLSDNQGGESFTNNDEITVQSWIVIMAQLSDRTQNWSPYGMERVGSLGCCR